MKERLGDTYHFRPQIEAWFQRQPTLNNIDFEYSMHKVLRDTFAVQIKFCRFHFWWGSPQGQSDLGLHLIGLISQIISSPEPKAISISMPLASVVLFARLFACLSVICHHF